MHKDSESILAQPLRGWAEDLSPSLRFFERWTVVFFIFSTCFHLFLFVVFHASGHLVYPFSLNDRDRFADFTVFTNKFPLFHSAAFFSSGEVIIYPSPAWSIFNFFFKVFAAHALQAFVLCSVLAFMLPAALFARTLMRRGIAPARAAVFMSVLCLLSWPALLIVDGANIEVAVWLTMVTAMWAYATGRLWLASVFFGLAASLKLFPFIFLALFLSRRHFTKVLVGAATFLLVTLASLKFAGPTMAVAYKGYQFGLDYAKVTYFTKWRFGEQGVDHSLFAFFKTLYLLVIRHGDKDFTRALQVDSSLTFIGGILLYFVRIRKLPLLNQVLVLSICAIYFTPFSGDGTLIHLYYPLAMMFLLSLQAFRDGVCIPGIRPMMQCMVFCLSMESFLVVPRVHFQIRLIGFAHCIALGILLLCALRYPLGPPLSEEQDETILSNPRTAWLRRLET